MAQYQFVMRSGPTPGKVYPLEQTELTIGRDTSNAITINDAEVSRKHAKLTLRGSEYVIEDLGSTNGTFVSGQRLSAPYTLRPGDLVSLGENIVLMFEATSDPNATMIASRKAAKAAVAAVPPPPAAPVAAPAPAPAPAYAGQVPAVAAPTAPAKQGNTKIILIVIGVLVLCVVLGCIASLLYADADPTGARWCAFPFNIVTQILGGVCP
ncbi:MAG: FHA domain-containing protein [Anaerolineales bacterium]